MGIYDRDYSQERYEGHYGRQVRITLPGLTVVVKWLLIINVGIFLAGFMIPSLGMFLSEWFSVYPATPGMSLQFWRLITYQFLHASIMHVLFNMLVLFFFGPMLERLWGSRQFLRFYLICGAVGGMLYPLFVLMGFLRANPLVGASGAILGLLAAGAILFPNMRVYLFGIFPVTMRALAILLVVISLLKIFSGDANAGGEVAHLGGMAAGAISVLYQPWRKKTMLKTQTGSRARRRQQQINFRAEVDRILDKVHISGISSLTRREKKILHQATELEQQNRR